MKRMSPVPQITAVFVGQQKAKSYLKFSNSQYLGKFLKNIDLIFRQHAASIYSFSVLFCLSKKVEGLLRRINDLYYICYVNNV